LGRALLRSGGGGKEWDRFTQALPHLEDLSLARSFTVLGAQVKCIQLHVFCDASSSGYGACAYVRVSYDDCVKCSLVIGKSRVAPLKGVIVPRLELTAAVLAAKLGTMVCCELDYELSRVVYWTDATVVLRYLNNTASRFQTFVANRLQLLHSLTSVRQWRYVPTALNPADVASRGFSPEKVNSADMLFYGPNFLNECESQWPEQPDFMEGLEEYDPELKRVKICTTVSTAMLEDAIYRLLRRYSNFALISKGQSRGY